MNEGVDTPTQTAAKANMGTENSKTKFEAKGTTILKE